MIRQFMWLSKGGRFLFGPVRSFWDLTLLKTDLGDFQIIMHNLCSAMQDTRGGKASISPIWPRLKPAEHESVFESEHVPGESHPVNIFPSRLQLGIYSAPYMHSKDKATVCGMFLELMCRRHTSPSCGSLIAGSVALAEPSHRQSMLVSGYFSICYSCCHQV